MIIITINRSPKNINIQKLYSRMFIKVNPDDLTIKTNDLILQMLIYLFTSILIICQSQSEPQSYQNFIELFGNFSLGYYYIDVLVGTPPIKHPLIIDTTTSSLYLNCQFCGGCNQSNNFLNPISQSAINVSCQQGGSICGKCNYSSPDDRCYLNFTQNNIELQGYYMKDYFLPKIYQKQRASKHNINMKNEGVFAYFTCSSNVNQNKIAHGKLGLSLVTQNLIMGKVASDQTQTNEYTICMGKNGGFFYFGTFSNTTKDQSVELQIKEQQNLYSIIINDIAVGKMNFNIVQVYISQRKGIIINSTAAFSYFPIVYYNKLISILQQVCSAEKCKSTDNGTRCYIFQFAEILNKFPNITLKKEWSQIQWIPSNYMINQSNNSYCLSILPGQEFILGMTWMVNKAITFRVSERKVKVRNSNCHIGNENATNNIYQNHEQQQIFMGLTFQTLVLCIVLMLLLSIIVGILVRRHWNRQEQELYADQQVQSKPGIQFVQEQNADNIQLGPYPHHYSKQIIK